MATHVMTISRLAAAAGVHVETVRYYQRRGLLPEPERRLGRVRRYGPNEISRLQFIRRAQTMGFSLNEIAGLLEVKGQRACEQTRQLTEHLDPWPLRARRAMPGWPGDLPRYSVVWCADRCPNRV
ncbi:MerR family transcriptional regulator [Pseudomonas aeruginosa]|uniref:MerR family transcriptional regulator n=1 Tax=Pseudomonas aeruginosa TaxID=287 RepID=UPI0022EAD035|nr:MerR family transcriptional regulator [Pseudomonas aeruginosa]MDA3364410.1 MerR family transcriptional regulator [Pseudomonas aeruginosa]